MVVKPHYFKYLYNNVIIKCEIEQWIVFFFFFEILMDGFSCM